MSMTPNEHPRSWKFEKRSFETVPDDRHHDFWLASKVQIKLSTNMQLVSLVVVIFPVTVAILALLIGYFVRQVENRISDIKLATENNQCTASSSEFTLSDNKALLDPYGAADKLLLDASALLDCGVSCWHTEITGTDWALESTCTASGPPLLRIRLRVESKKNISAVFETLTGESFLSNLYPVSCHTTRFNVSYYKPFNMFF